MFYPLIGFGPSFFGVDYIFSGLRSVSVHVNDIPDQPHKTGFGRYVLYTLYIIVYK